MEERVAQLETRVQLLESLLTNKSEDSKEEEEYDSNNLEEEATSSLLLRRPLTPPSLKIVLVGDPKVGKSSLRDLFAASGQEESEHVKLLDVSKFSGFDNARVSCWKASSTSHAAASIFLVQAHAVILMFDVTDRKTYKNVPTWYKTIRNVCETCPVVLCGNKSDAPDRKVRPKEVQFHRKKNLQYYEISTTLPDKANRPFNYLARKLVVTLISGMAACQA